MLSDSIPSVLSAYENFSDLPSTRPLDISDIKNDFFTKKLFSSKSSSSKSSSSETSSKYYTVLIIIVSAIIFVTVISIYDVVKNSLNLYFTNKAIMEPSSNNSKDIIQRTKTTNKYLLLSSIIFSIICIIFSIISLYFLYFHSL